MAYCSFSQEPHFPDSYAKLLEKTTVQFNVDKYKELFMMGSDSVLIENIEMEIRDTFHFAETLIDTFSSEKPFDALKIYTSQFTIPVIIGLKDTLLGRKFQDLIYEPLEPFVTIPPAHQNLSKKWYPKWKSSSDPKSGEIRHTDLWDVLYLDSSFLTIVNERETRFYNYTWRDSTWKIGKEALFYFPPYVKLYHYDSRTLEEIDFIKELTIKGGEKKLRKYFKAKFRESFDKTEEEYDVRIRFKIVSIDYAIVNDELEAQIYLDKHDNYDPFWVKQHNYYEVDFYDKNYSEILPFFKEKYKDLVTDGWWSNSKTLE